MTRRYSIPIREWPEGDRPREKLLAHGPDALTDAELLAIMLRTGDGASHQSALDHARELLKRFGSLEEIERAGQAEICEIPGIGPAKAAAIKAALALGRRLLNGKKIDREPITSPENVYRRFRGRLAGATKESFWALLLDTRGKVIKETRISEGTLTEALVHPREVFQPAIRECAAKIIFVHNHPSGDTTPSNEDREMHRRLVEAGTLLGIPVLDHLIIGADSFCCVETPEQTEEAQKLAADTLDDEE